MNIEFSYPFLGWLFLAIPVLLAFEIYFQTWRRFSSFSLNVKENKASRSEVDIEIKIRFVILKVLLYLSLSCLIIAGMNPQKKLEFSSAKQYGVDIVLALDASQSMSAKDFSSGTRFDVAKRVLLNFISKRDNDRIGLVIFAADAYVQSPQTTEYESLKQIVANLELGQIDYRKTAIGAALGVSASRLLKSEAENKLIILITDGVDTAFNKLRPSAATAAVKELKIKVYTIGIGTNRYAPTDFSLLKEISKQTKAKFFRATNTEEFVNYMNEIDALEKSFVSSKRYRLIKEYAIYFIWMATAFLFLYFLLKGILWRVAP